MYYICVVVYAMRKAFSISSTPNSKQKLKKHIGIMKKILLSLTFIAAMLTSCVSDYGELNYAGKDAIDVVIGVGASELAQSRAAQSDMNSGLGAIDNFF